MLRGEVWPTLVSENESQFKKIESQYPHFLKKISPFQSEIATDISRTFPAHPKFVNNEKGQMELFRVLKAYSNYDSQIGYCQVNYSIALRHQKSREKLILIGKKGTNFIVATLLVQMPEETAFAVFVCLMYRLGSPPYILCL